MNNIGEIIREHRNSIPLSLGKLSRISGVSTSHLGRIEIGQRVPSARILQLVAEPLGFHPNELLVLPGYLTPEPSVLPKERNNELRAELNMLLERMISDRNRIREIVNRLLTTS
jgi:transcriptional regulator with XRE-family HTH domain